MFWSHYTFICIDRVVLELHLALQCYAYLYIKDFRESGINSTSHDESNHLDMYDIVRPFQGWWHVIFPVQDVHSWRYWARCVAVPSWAMCSWLRNLHRLCACATWRVETFLWIPGIDWHRRSEDRNTEESWRIIQNHEDLPTGLLYSKPTCFDVNFGLKDGDGCMLENCQAGLCNHLMYGAMSRTTARRLAALRSARMAQVLCATVEWRIPA